MTLVVPYLREAQVVVRSTGRPSLILRDLFIKFSIRWEASETAAAGDIEIYNLATSTETHIRQRGDGVSLLAGYRGSDLDLIATGDIRRVERRRSGADRVTAIRFGGHVAATASAIFTRAYEGVVSLSRVVEDVIETMDGVDVGDLSAIPAAATISGRSFALPSTTVLTGLLLSQELGWYEEDGAINITARDRSVSPQSGTLVISERSGMVGTPTVTDDGVRVRTLLDSRIRLDVRFAIESIGLDLGGIYHVASYEHSGDNRGGGWYTDIEGRPVD